MKKIIIAIVVGAIAILGLLYAVKLLFPDSAIGKVGSEHFLTNTDKYAAATTTRAYLGGTQVGLASTTLFDQVSVAKAERISFNLMAEASSTSVVLKWYYQFSEDGVDWFNETNQGTISGGAFTVNAANSNKVIHQWTPATTATTSMSVLIDPVPPASWMRIIMGSSVGSSSVWGQLVRLDKNEQ